VFFGTNAPRNRLPRIPAMSRSSLGTVDAVNAQERIISTVTKVAHTEVTTTGTAGFFDESFDELAREAGGDERDGRHARQVHCEPRPDGASMLVLDGEDI
jgi:hypothetical protein